MRTARLIISQEEFFDRLGYKDFKGAVSAVGINKDVITLFINGNDERLPNMEDYPNMEE